MRRVLKKIEVLIRVKYIKLLLSLLDVSKSLGPDEIHPKIFNYLSSNENFVIAMYKLFEKCIEYEMILYIWKRAIVTHTHTHTHTHIYIYIYIYI